MEKKEKGDKEKVVSGEEEKKKVAGGGAVEEDGGAGEGGGGADQVKHSKEGLEKQDKTEGKGSATEGKKAPIKTPIKKPEIKEEEATTQPSTTPPKSPATPKPQKATSEQKFEKKAIENGINGHPVMVVTHNPRPVII